MADEHRAFDPEVVEEGLEVAVMAFEAGLCRRTTAAPVPALVEHDAGVVLGEIRYLAPPVQVCGAATVREHERRPGPHHLVVQVDAVN